MIYRFKGSLKLFLTEKFDTIESKDISIYAWKSKSNRLGFDVDETGASFLRQLVADSKTILFPRILLIKDDRDTEKEISDFRGVSFWGINSEIEELYKEYEIFLALNARNKLLERYNKPMHEIPSPAISKWYAGEKYSPEFLQFCYKHDSVEFIIWDWSDFGIYFYQPFASENIEKKISKLCADLSIELIKVNDILRMPYD